jgi:DNA polymerase-3 subunit alpha (Gram-positive type)
MAQRLGPDNYTVFDLEMTGLSAKTDKVIEIGAVRFRDGQPEKTYAALVNPHMPIPKEVTELTGITNEMTAEQGIAEDTALRELLDFIGDDIIVGQNILFDYAFLKQWAVNKKRPLDLFACDTLKIARTLLPNLASRSLESLCIYYQIRRENAHRAPDDALETGLLFERLKGECADRIAEGTIAPEAGEALLTPKLLQYKAKRQTPVTPHQVKQLQEYRRAHQLTDEINWETLTRNEASRIMDRYYAQYGRL